MSTIKKHNYSNEYKNLSVLKDDTEFNGTMKFKNPVQLNGKYTGKIITESVLIVSENAYIEGEVRSGILILAGTVKGDVHAEEKIDILPSGKLYGNIATKKLRIADGVIFDGTCKMLQ